MKKKIYPKVWYDTSIKFIFDDDWRHYTIRFAWQPSILTEQFYKSLWWDTFLESYNKFINDPKSLDKTETKKIKESIELTKQVTNILVAIGDRWRSPFAIYADDFIEN